jgi:hypothetical protein
MKELPKIQGPREKKLLGKKKHSAMTFHLALINFKAHFEGVN